MRLKPAIALEDYDDTVSGFGRRGRRADRRERRQQRRRQRREGRADRRDARKERRQERRLDRVQRRKAKVRDKLSRLPEEGAPRGRRGRRGRGGPSLQPAPDAWPPEQQAERGGWMHDVLDHAEELLNEDGYDDEHDGDFDELDDFEGVGARRPGRPGPSPSDGAWGPAVRMGRKLRIQAAAGHRAAVIDLKPGLYLVAELPEAVTRTEFGVAPVLAPLMITAARRAIDDRQGERRGPLSALFRRRNQGPVRYVQVQPAAQPQAAPLALPGPVASEPVAEPMVVAAPNVGWADDDTVAAAYGCDRCDRSRR